MLGSLFRFNCIVIHVHVNKTFNTMMQYLGSLTAVSILTTAKSTDTPTTADDKSRSSPTVMIVGASLGAVLFVALIILIIVILLRRKKRQEKGKESLEVVKMKLLLFAI